MPFRAVRGWLIAAAIFLAACEPEATPFPVDIPTPATATPAPEAAAPVRYALAANTAGSVKDVDLLKAGAQVIELTDPYNPADLGAEFDLIAAFGSHADAALSPIQVHYSLLIDTTQPPLDNPVLADIISRSINPEALASTIEIPGVQFPARESTAMAVLRAELANAGWPDGFDLALQYEGLVGIREVSAYFQRLGIHLRLSPLSDAQAPLVLVTWSTPEQRNVWLAGAGRETYLVDLYSLPISYWVMPGFDVTFSPQGWPIAKRS